MTKTYKHLGTISVFFVAVLLISNIASTKIVQFGPLTFDGGTLLFPLSYIFADILTEVYGFSRARRVIWLGFICAAVMSILLYIVQILPPAADWPNQDAYNAILGQAPRIVLASLIAYLCGEFLNSFVLAKMKVWTAGKSLWTRTIGSTLVGELVDSTLFILIAFAGVLPGALLVTLIISNYVFKTFIEVVFTPMTYAIVRYLKRSEGEDYFDRNTNFNPFLIRNAE
ncbi:VUT family protein [Candidatus Parcubacteria bacterium]|nr:MAG: VUT family protein [Candidatus Parcubacteria bacterium]